MTTASSTSNLSSSSSNDTIQVLEHVDRQEENPLSWIVQNQKIAIVPSFKLESGVELQSVPVAYKTWGTLNREGTNVMVLCHALSGSADVEDWWQTLIGKKSAFDTEKFFIFCGNALGSPYGSASPVTNNPVTGKRYGPDFPLTTVRDDVRIHKRVLDSLGVKQIQYAIGGSMGGMHVLEWACMGPDYVKNFVPIATSGRHSAWCISWGEAQRQAIYSDPNYMNGYYTPDKPPNTGLAAARMSALLTYRSRNSFESRFGRKPMAAKPISKVLEETKSNDPNTPTSAESLIHNEGNQIRLHGTKPGEVKPTSEPKKSSQSLTSEEWGKETGLPLVYSAQSYLRYQGDKFVKRFDANCYIAITRKLDTHDVSRGRGEYEEVLAGLTQPCLVIGIASDGLFTIGEQYELAEFIPNSEMAVIESPDGHDGFLLEFDQMTTLLKDFIKKNTPDLWQPPPGEGEIEQSPPKPSMFGEKEGDLLHW